MRRKRMTIDEALRRVRELYETALEIKHIRNPVAWALYQVWRETDNDGKYGGLS